MGRVRGQARRGGVEGRISRPMNQMRSQSKIQNKDGERMECCVVVTEDEWTF